VLALLLKIVILGAGVLALRSLTSPVWGILFGVVVVVNTVLIYIGPFARWSPAVDCPP